MNEFEVGSHIEWMETPKSRVEVILWISTNRSNCICIDTDCKNKSANPVRLSTADIELALACAKARIVSVFAIPDSLTVLQDSHFQKYLDKRDKAWEIIEPLVNDLRIFDTKLRGKLITERAREKKFTSKVIWKYLRLYWQSGQKKNALLPQYSNCGGSRKIRCTQVGVKRGRPSKLKVEQGVETGRNADEEVRRKFRKGISLYFENSSGATLRDAYNDTIRWLFNVGVNTINGVDYPILPLATERPQFEQFKYWYYRERRLSKSIILRHGEHEFNLNHRALDGNPMLHAFGPGSIFELDSTVADNYVVSALDRNRILGRPILYFIKDVFSRLIVGIGISLNGPSWETAMIALENMTVDKVAFCKEFGIYIAPWQWPSHHLPRSIRADRGELLSKNSDALVNFLEIEIDNTAPYRPDWKGMIEQNFKLMDDMTIRWIPGQSNQFRKRGEKDYRYDASLTMYEFRQMIISSVIEYNTTHWLDNYRKDEYMIADHVNPVPIELWNWGIQNRSGVLRTEERETVRLALLPREQASITPMGIHFKGSDYSCERAKGEEWYEKARLKRVRIPVTYDPRNTDTIFLRLDETPPDVLRFLSPEGNKTIETASLMKKELRFSGCDWQDVEDYFAIERQAKVFAETDASQLQSDQNTFRKNVVKQAKEKTADARRGQSNASRVEGMTGTKNLESDAERTADAWVPPLPKTLPSQASPRVDTYKQAEYEWLERMRSGGTTDGH